MRFFIDNCLAHKHAAALHIMVKPLHSVTHLTECFLPNATDELWLATLSTDPDWTVISGDYRIVRSKHLRRAWLDSGITSFFLKDGWMNQRLFIQHSRLIARFPEMISKAEGCEPGTGFSVPWSGQIERLPQD